ncbi:MAG: hypothetical protein ACR2KV_02785 [Solirubrobacteraceae bacterium]
MSERFGWGQAGSVYYATDEGRIVALLYWEAAGVLDGPDGEPVFTDPGWFWLAADTPDRHWPIEAPDLYDGMGDAERTAVIDAALAAAAGDILRYLDGHGRL